MHCVTSQTGWRHNAVACSHNSSSVTAPLALPSPCRVSLKWHVSTIFINAMKEIANWKNMSLKVYNIQQTRAITIPSVHNICMIKARTHGFVQNDSRTHSPGVTGLHSRLRQSCNPVTQSRAFHSHFAPTHPHAPVLSRYTVMIPTAFGLRDASEAQAHVVKATTISLMWPISQKAHDLNLYKNTRCSYVKIIVRSRHNFVHAKMTELLW